MTTAALKAKAWIDQDRDPRSAHWQAGLESIMDLFLPQLEKGKIIAVKEMDENDHDHFTSLLQKVDVSPGVYAAFSPSAIADAIVPPESATELIRIDKGTPSCKLIILRPGEENRIICAEISDQAHKPGLDIFQSGALLGTYDYDNREECLDGLAKAVKAHIWKTGGWQTVDYHCYTLNWFERVRFLGTPEVSLDKSVSFFHSPTLVKGTQVDALFLLIYLVLIREYASKDFLSAVPGLSEKIKQKDSNFCRTLAQNHILELLNFIKDKKLMDFAQFRDKDHAEFQREFERAQEKLRDRLIHIKP